MNGEFEPAKVTVKITKLKEEKRLITESLLGKTGSVCNEKEEYIKYFPHDEYDNETD